MNCLSSHVSAHRVEAERGEGADGVQMPLASLPAPQVTRTQAYPPRT